MADNVFSSLFQKKPAPKKNSQPKPAAKPAPKPVAPKKSEAQLQTKKRKLEAPPAQAPQTKKPKVVPEQPAEKPVLFDFKKSEEPAEKPALFDFKKPLLMLGPQPVKATKKPRHQDEYEVSSEEFDSNESSDELESGEEMEDGVRCMAFGEGGDKEVVDKKELRNQLLTFMSGKFQMPTADADSDEEEDGSQEEGGEEIMADFYEEGLTSSSEEDAEPERERIPINVRDKTIFVGGIPMNTRKNDIRDYFKSHCGRITDVRVLPTKNPEKGTTAAFIDFGTLEGAQKAVNLHNTKWMGKFLDIREASAPRPSREDYKKITRPTEGGDY